MNNQKRSRIILSSMMALIFSLPYVPLASAQTLPTPWTSIGPTPIFQSGLQVGGIGFGQGPVSGRVATIAVDPLNASHWLMGSAYGGVWETRDAGSTWIPRTDNQPTQAMGAIAFAPGNPQIVYAGTGEATGDWGFAGVGLLKSLNGGETWQLISDKFTNTSVREIKVDPQNPDSLVVATSWGRYPYCAVCPALPIDDSRPMGVFKSANGGKTWDLKLLGIASDLIVRPDGFTSFYAGVGKQIGDAGKHPGEALNGLYRSLDGAETWRRVHGPWEQKPGGIGTVRLAVGSSNSNILYVLIAEVEINDVANTLGIWRTSNAWDAVPTWEEIPDPGLGGHDPTQLKITVDQADSDVIFAGRVDLWRWQRGSLQPWTNVGGQLHVDYHAMAWEGNRLIVGNDGGVYSTIDRGNNWSNHNETLSITQFWHGSSHPTNPNIVIAGSQDNGTSIRTTSSNAWKLVLGGDGFDNTISSSKPDTQWAVSLQRTNIYRTKNALNFDRVAPGTITDGTTSTLFEMCPTNDNFVLVGGTKHIWKTENFFSSSPAQPTWFDNNSPSIPEKAGIGTGLSAIAFAASDRTCRTYAFATTYPQIYLTKDGGTNWEEIFIDSGATCCIQDVAFDPTDANTLYATVSPGGNWAVLKTKNALDPAPIWINITPTGMPTASSALLVDPLFPDNVYVGTMRDIWRSPDGGRTWTQMGPEAGLPRVPIFDLQANMLGDIFAFTYGRGAYVLHSPLVTRTTDPSPGQCLPNDCSQREAIMGANNTPGRDVIKLPAGVYTLTQTGPGEDAGGTGDIDITDDLTIIGAGAANTIIDGGKLDRVFHVHKGVKAEFNGITIRNGLAASGGGILAESETTVQVNNSLLSANTARTGGGIWVGPFAEVQLTETTVSNNKATQSAPGVDASSGGGIFGTAAEMVSLINSTVHGNTSDGSGGGIEQSSGGTLDLLNTTIVSNSAAGSGGGILLRPTVNASIINSTISDNKAARGGGVEVLGGTLVLANSILAGNMALSPGVKGPDCFGGNVKSNGHSILGNVADCVIAVQQGDQITNPRLGGFVNPGSPGQGRFPLLSISPAIDAGESILCTDALNFPELASDQLKKPRSVDGKPDGMYLRACDIGAVEFFPVVNNLLNYRQSELFTQYDPTPVPGAPAGVYTIRAKFDNNTDMLPGSPAFDPVRNKAIFYLFAEIAALQLSRQGAAEEGQPVLLNADGGPGRVGARLTPAGSLTMPLNPGAIATLQFKIGLKKREPFVFFINMLGEIR